MALTIRVFGNLVNYSPTDTDQFSYEIQHPITVSALLEALGIPKGHVWMVTVNDVKVGGSHVVYDGDEVMIFEPVLGG